MKSSDLLRNYVYEYDSKTSTDFHGLYFVTNALKTIKQDRRMHISRMYIGETTRPPMDFQNVGKPSPYPVALCTDGSRLHMYYLLNVLPRGYYRIAKRTKLEMTIYLEDVDEKYPEVDDIFWASPGDPYDVGYLNFQTSFQQAYTNIVALGIRHGGDTLDWAYRIEYFQSLPDYMKCWYKNHESGILHLANSRLEAVVMPMNVSKDVFKPKS